MIDPSTRDHILHLEHRLLDPVIRKSRQALAQLLADDFVEFTNLGTVCRKREVIDALQHELSQQRLIAEFEVVSLAEGVVLATYRLTRQGATAESPSAHSLRSSIWKLNLGKWQISFHQGTPCAVAS